jgi:hypothetical protein
MNGTFSRVFLAYPLIIPVVFGALAMIFPTFFYFDQETGRVTISFTTEQLYWAVGAGYGAIAAVFAKWGIKR